MSIHPPAVSIHQFVRNKATINHELRVYFGRIPRTWSPCAPSAPQWQGMQYEDELDATMVGTGLCHGGVAPVPGSHAVAGPPPLGARLGQASWPCATGVAGGPRDARGRRLHRPPRLRSREHCALSDVCRWHPRPRFSGRRGGAVSRCAHRWRSRCTAWQSFLAGDRRRRRLCPVCQRQRRADRPRS